MREQAVLKSKKYFGELKGNGFDPFVQLPVQMQTRIGFGKDENFSA
jgi:hypothetical protein